MDFYPERTVVAPPANDDHPAERPVLRVIRGNPTQEEIAALVAVLLSLPAEEEATPAPRRSAWSDRSRLLRHPLFPGHGTWRRSGLPS